MNSLDNMEDYDRLAKLCYDLKTNNAKFQSLLDASNQGWEICQSSSKRMIELLNEQLAEKDKKLAEQDLKLTSAQAVLAAIAKTRNSCGSKSQEAQMAEQCLLVRVGFSDELHKREAASYKQGVYDTQTYIEWIWANCRIIYFPKADDELGTYPIEHNPFAKKDSRCMIESKMPAVQPTDESKSHE
jgi:hypothetical protein